MAILRITMEDHSGNMDLPSTGQFTFAVFLRDGPGADLSLGDAPYKEYVETPWPNFAQFLVGEWPIDSDFSVFDEIDISLNYTGDWTSTPDFYMGSFFKVEVVADTVELVADGWSFTGNPAEAVLTPLEWPLLPIPTGEECCLLGRAIPEVKPPPWHNQTSWGRPPRLFQLRSLVDDTYVLTTTVPPKTSIGSTPGPSGTNNNNTNQPGTGPACPALTYRSFTDGCGNTIHYSVAIGVTSFPSGCPQPSPPFVHPNCR